MEVMEAMEREIRENKIREGEIRQVKETIQGDWHFSRLSQGLCQ
jgi:hypothetical protein